MKSDKHGGYTQGPVWRHVVNVSGFMILGFLAMTLGQLVLTFYVGLVGKEELAAIAFSFPLVMGLSALTRGIGIGASTLLARTVGSGDRQGGGVLSTHAFYLAIIFTLSLSLLVWLTAEMLFLLLGAEGRVSELAVGYTRIWLLSFPLAGIALVATGMIRAFGNPAWPGLILSIGPIVQVIIAPALIFGWLGLEPLGLDGAGWAIVGSNVVQALLVAYWFLMKEKVLAFVAKDFISSARGILHIAIPASASNLIQPLSAGVITWMLSGYGNLVVAGFGVASRIEAVVGMVAIGISTSVVPVMGQNWGARKFERVNELLKICHLSCLFWSLIAAIIMWTGAEFFIGLVNDDPQIMDSAIMFLYIVPVTIGFMGMINVSTHSFNTLRKPGLALLLSLSRLLIVYIPLAFLGSWMFGYVGIFAATAFTNVLIGIIAVFWNKTIVQRESNILSA